MARNRTLGYTNYKTRPMEKSLSIVKGMGSHNNSKHHLLVNKPHQHHDLDSPR